ncbi:imelysin family protein [Robiginitalea marina]|uniref:Imelysin family protein n=1 Tax=Robiginitalea marina TaxID=2954105 RepID=A0ABT1B1U2_9FLAO|nr:imelysin family protein [Robiginitalea marina]MCO5725862.1 imelysin family protein [Robiginitalea marina]
MKRFWYLFVLTAGLLWACSSDGSDDPNPPTDGGNNGGGGNGVTFDRGAMLENWADNIIIPAYEAFLGDLDALQASFESFRTTPDQAGLEALRASWLQAYLEWQRVSMFEIGPAEQDGLRLNVNTYPADVALIESHVSSGTYDFNLPSNRDAKGFPALDYLLNGLGATDAEILAAFSSTPNYAQYVEDILADIDTRVRAVSDAWKGGFRDTFVASDGASATASTDRFVNDYIFYYEKFLRAGKMGIPLGVFTGTPAPQTLEAFYSPGIGNLLFLEGLDAVQDFFNGRHVGSTQQGESLASYLRALNTVKNGVALDVVINDQFDTARDMVTALQAFKTEIEENTPPTDMLMAYDEVQRVVPLLKVDMVSAMSIAIDFVDADGD